MKNTRKIKGIVNWMIPKDSDEGMFYAHTLLDNQGTYNREAKVISTNDISIPPKMVVSEIISIKPKDVFTNHQKFIQSHMTGPKPSKE